MRMTASKAVALPLGDTPTGNVMVGRARFELAKHEAADLQSAGFDRSPTCPFNICVVGCLSLPCIYYMLI
ncbi:hypothetical protein VCHA53O466_40187 [Vibrio chagasii]|nr:hypothetical protein VCHA53O466_40187 [Vibrio chagasii]